MNRRWVLLALVVLVLAPGTFLRTPVPPSDFSSDVTIRRLADVPDRLGPFTVRNVWQLASANDLFNSYSGLRAVSAGRYLAVSDRGHAIRFSIRGDRLTEVELREIAQDSGYGEKYTSDIEALAVDPDTGRLWLAYEGLNAIERRDAALANSARVKPEAMSDWLTNSGPEAMVRFDDGSMIVIGEGTRAWSDKRLPAVMFAGDPVDAATGVSFAFRAPEDFRPTDMAALPDGRVLFLLRRLDWGFPPGFEIGLLVADPAEIAAGKTWSGQLLTTFKYPFPTDNYEGLAVESDGGYPVTITMISDDNGISYQRTLVTQLEWDGSDPE